MSQFVINLIFVGASFCALFRHCHLARAGFHQRVLCSRRRCAPGVNGMASRLDERGIVYLHGRPARHGRRRRLGRI